MSTIQDAKEQLEKGKFLSFDVINLSTKEIYYFGVIKMDDASYDIHVVIHTDKANREMFAAIGYHDLIKIGGYLKSIRRWPYNKNQEPSVQNF